jgi:hypothetical protein
MYCFPPIPSGSLRWGGHEPSPLQHFLAILPPRPPRANHQLKLKLPRPLWARVCWRTSLLLPRHFNLSLPPVKFSSSSAAGSNQANTHIPITAAGSLAQLPHSLPSLVNNPISSTISSSSSAAISSELLKDLGVSRVTGNYTLIGIFSSSMLCE